MQEQAGLPPEMSDRLVYRVTAGDVESGGNVSAAVKSELKIRGLPEKIARRAGIVVFEGEMNLILYANEGGTVQVDVLPNAVDIRIEDNGPGIEDVEQALTPGYSTAPEWALELGFGAGMGLVNMRNQCDRFEIQSRPGEGTWIHCVIERGRDAAE